jgi:hypothetical protein
MPGPALRCARLYVRCTCVVTRTARACVRAWCSAVHGAAWICMPIWGRLCGGDPVRPGQLLRGRHRARGAVRERGLLVPGRLRVPRELALRTRILGYRRGCGELRQRRVRGALRGASRPSVQRREHELGGRAVQPRDVV